ncbi:MAG: site-2 protease family protein [Chloroflexi bacterium]|nr:site-2 protease family protein [Chloroflexota bacterium]
MSIGMQVFAFLLVLGPLVFIHELGHFLAAKRAGIRVLEFGMFYPPRALRLWRGQGSMLIGSRQVIIPRNFKLPKVLEEGKVVRATADKVNDRLILKSITILEETPVTAPTLDQFSANEAFLYGEVSEFDPGTEYTLNWLPLGGFVRMLGEEGLSGKGSFGDAPKRWRAITLLAGPGMNLIAALIVFTATYMIGYPEIPIMIRDVAAGSPAQQAGIQAGDAIVAVGGDPIRRIDQVQTFVSAHRGSPINLTMKRGDETFAVTVTPRTVEQTPEGQGAMGVQLGNDGNYNLQSYPFGQAVSFAIGDISDTVQQIVTLPTRLLSGLIAPSEARVMGPVGISQVAGLSVQNTVETGESFWILNLVAQISLALGITNLLPLPALDGGRLIFVLIEAVRRKRVSPEREAVVHLIGMAMLLGLMVLITIQDLSNPIIPN